MKFILGKKEEMTEYFREDGAVIPVTALSIGPAVVTRVFEKEKDGYRAVQIGFWSGKAKFLGKARLGQTNGQAFVFLREFRVKGGDEITAKQGDTLDISIFTPGEKLQISSVSKGKGFQGVVKRHKFKGGPRSHGQKHSEREPGSIGGGLRTRVPRGMRMAGRMGGDRITQKNLEVIAVDPETNLIFIKGAVAGPRGALVEIRSS